MKHLSSCHSPFFCIVREKTAIPVKHSEKNLSSDSFFSVWQPFSQGQSRPVLTGDAGDAELAPRVIEVFAAHEGVLAGNEGIEQELAFMVCGLPDAAGVSRRVPEYSTAWSPARCSS